MMNDLHTKMTSGSAASNRQPLSVKAPGHRSGLLGLACLALLLVQPVQAQPAGEVPNWPACIQRLQADAVKAGVSKTTATQWLHNLQPDASVLIKLDQQPEFKTPIWDYMAALVDAERVQDGQQRLDAHRDVLTNVTRTYGIPAPTVVAVWGVESNYGQSFGKHPLVQSLATLSCAGRRQAFFQKELWATLRIAQSGDVAPEALVGSWAGAFGHTQFMPTTYERLAVDFDGDGRRDLTSSIPDALASTAHFLQRAGWQPGVPWGVEVRWAQANLAGEGRKTKRPTRTWTERGVELADGRPLTTVFPPDTPLGLLAPKGPSGEVGPLFLVSRNFDALFAYNAAESYGLAIAHLADRLAGASGFKTPWPTDDLGLSRAERRQLQAALIGRGHDIGVADGMLGERSRQAIRVEQERLGHPVNGRAGQRLLRALQATP